MLKAIEQAEIAAAENEVPVGAVIVRNDEIVATGRNRRVYFGAYDLKNGACGTITNLFQMPFNFKPESVGGIMQEECSKLLTDFFKNLRNKKS